MPHAEHRDSGVQYGNRVLSRQTILLLRLLFRTRLGQHSLVLFCRVVPGSFSQTRSVIFGCSLDVGREPAARCSNCFRVP